MDEIAVLVALSSRLMRARLLLGLRGVPGILAAREAEDAESVAAQLQAEPSLILLVDGKMLLELIKTRLQDRVHVLRVVLMISTDDLPPVSQPIRLAGTVPLGMPPHDLVARIRQFFAVQEKPPADLPPDIRHRFHVTGPVQMPPSAPPPAAPAPRMPRPPLVTHDPISRAHGGRRRAVAARLEALVAALLSVQQEQRDAVTGLPGPSALEQIWTLLPQAQQAATFVAVEVQDQRSAPVVSPPPDPTLLRRMSAALRANVRREDLVSRAGPATFVLLLPGVREDDSAEPVRRLRMALAEGCGRQLTATQLRLAVGVSHWEAGKIPTAVLAQCLLALRNVQATPPPEV